MTVHVRLAITVEPSSSQRRLASATDSGGGACAFTFFLLLFLLKRCCVRLLRIFVLFCLYFFLVPSVMPLCRGCSHPYPPTIALSFRLARSRSVYVTYRQNAAENFNGITHFISISHAYNHWRTGRSAREERPRCSHRERSGHARAITWLPEFAARTSSKNVKLRFGFRRVEIGRTTSRVL